MNLRKIIITEAERRGWSAYRLAQEAGLNIRTTQSYFSGERDVNSARVGKMLDALGIELKIRKGGR